MSNIALKDADKERKSLEPKCKYGKKKCQVKFTSQSLLCCAKTLDPPLKGFMGAS